MDIPQLQLTMGMEILIAIQTDTEDMEVGTVVDMEEVIQVAMVGVVFQMVEMNIKLFNLFN